MLMCNDYFNFYSVVYEALSIFEYSYKYNKTQNFSKNSSFVSIVANTVLKIKV